MGKVITQASMSLDGYIAELSDNVGPLFDWSTTGDVEVTGSDPNMVFRVSAPSASYLREVWANIRASVIGRRLFDLANGWDGRPPVGEAVFVVTHQAPTDWDFPQAPFTFVTDGVESAVGRRSPSLQRRTSPSARATLAGRRSRPGWLRRCVWTWWGSSWVPVSPTSAATPDPLCF